MTLKPNTLIGSQHSQTVTDFESESSITASMLFAEHSSSLSQSQESNAFSTRAAVKSEQAGEPSDASLNGEMQASSSLPRELTLFSGWPAASSEAIRARAASGQRFSTDFGFEPL